MKIQFINTRADTIILSSKKSAKKVLKKLLSILDDYKFVSVFDYYDIIGHRPFYMDCNYGWTDLSTVEVIETDVGWFINLPELKKIDSEGIR